jgi:hypothetical protein
MRLGRLEKSILVSLKTFREDDSPIPKIYEQLDIALLYEVEWSKDLVPILYLRNRLSLDKSLPSPYQHWRVIPSFKASFSRALTSLERKGLIKSRKDVSENGYRTYVALTDKGKDKATTLLNANFLVEGKKLTFKEVAPVSVGVEEASP